MLFLLAAGCAEVGPPPGGEIDDNPPELVSVSPPNGAVNVPLSNRVEFVFSERVVKPTRGREFFISPRPEEEPDINWKGERVEIVFPDSFNLNQTYIISPGVGLADLRGNRFDSSLTVAFSTGPTIDSGHVAGAVFAADRPKAGLLVALYDRERISDTVVWDSLRPDYLAETNAAGHFSFQYLPEKQYRLIAFEDRNRDELFNPARESFALTDRPVKVGGSLPLDDLRLVTTQLDTVEIALVSAAFTQNNLLQVRTSRPVPVDLLRTAPGSLGLLPFGDTAAAIPARAVLETADNRTSTITASFQDVAAGDYRVRLIYDADRPALYYDSVTFAPAEDRRAPRIVAFRPDSIPVFLRDLAMRLVVSEPLDTTLISDETFSLWDGDDNRLRLTHLWRDPFHLEFDSPDLAEGAAYRFTVAEFDLRDRAGNAVGDSLNEYTFSSLATDSLGSVSGEIIVELPDRTGHPVVLEFENIVTTGRYDIAVSGRDFVLDLPAGKYLLTGFIDSDLNGRLSPGALDPFSYAETSAVYPDTVQVRARFETAGIELYIR